MHRIKLSPFVEVIRDSIGKYICSLPFESVPHARTQAVIEKGQRNVRWPKDHCAPFLQAGVRLYSGPGRFKNTSGDRLRLEGLKSDARNDILFSSESRLFFFFAMSLNKSMSCFSPFF